MNDHHTPNATSDPLEARLSRIEREIEAIRQRNQRVELEKRWETSTVRRTYILLLTYGLMSAVFAAIGAPNPLVNAIVPSLGYFLSTLYLRSVKNSWIEHLIEKK